VGAGFCSLRTRFPPGPAGREVYERAHR